MISSIKLIMSAMGLDDLISEDDLNLELFEQITRVYQEYLVAAEDGNTALQALKLKQYKELFKKVAMEMSEKEGMFEHMTAKELREYEEELDEIAGRGGGIG